MSKRVSLTRDLFTALVWAATDSPCTCSLPELCKHDGVCISCWALKNRIELLRSVTGKRGIGDDYFRAKLGKLEDEQRLRAKQLPASEAEVLIELAGMEAGDE